MNDWYLKSFRRNLVDMHIEDWDSRFLSKLDARKYVAMLKKALIQSAMIYANSHIGYCYWPTKSGQMHRGLNGKDHFGNVTSLCHDEDIDVIAYYSLIFNNWAHDAHPKWQMRTWEGKSNRDLKGVGISNGRFGVCCPNNDQYRRFVVDQINELLSTYTIEGIFFDMNWWPIICYCDSCRERYKKEAGKEIPLIINWSDSEWLSFAKKREDWLTEFALLAYSTVKKINPMISVEHNFNTILMTWVSAFTDRITEAVDFVSGDFYGGMLEQNYICKLMNSISPNMPFEFMTSRCFPSLNDHTSIKPFDMLNLENYLALSNGGAFFFIDAMDPEGTMNERVYETMGEIFKDSKEYEKYIGGEICADVAIYSSNNSFIDLDDNGKKVKPVPDPIFTKETLPAHISASVSATRVLKEHHIPYTVISKKNLRDLNRYQVLVLSGVVMMDNEEEIAIQEWINSGGKLYFSSFAPVEFIARLLDMEYEGMTKENVTYIYPTQSGSFLIEETKNGSTPVTILKPQFKVKLNKKTDIFATIGLPFTDPANSKRFASIHSNPPGKNTSYPSIVYSKYGRGDIIWASTPIEIMPSGYETQNNIFVEMINFLAKEPMAFCSDASPYVEFTLFHQKEKSRFLLNFINLQENIPIIPLHNIKVNVNTKGKKILNVSLLPDEKVLDFEAHDNNIIITIDYLDVYKSVLIYYE